VRIVEEALEFIPEAGVVSSSDRQVADVGPLLLGHQSERPVRAVDRLPMEVNLVIECRDEQGRSWRLTRQVTPPAGAWLHYS
jgi:hypothetical protein